VDTSSIRATPHTFRHQAITWLTRHSGTADAELQLITGYARQETLAAHQHIALDGELEKEYQDRMRGVPRQSNRKSGASSAALIR
jgi:hypothetical protein